MQFSWPFGLLATASLLIGKRSRKSHGHTHLPVPHLPYFSLLTKRSKHWPKSAGKPAAAKSIREQVWKYATGYNRDAQTTANPSRKRTSGASEEAGTGAKRAKRRTATEDNGEASFESEGEKDSTQERKQAEALAAEREERFREQEERRRQALERLEADDDEVSQERKMKQATNGGMFVIREQKDGVVRADFGVDRPRRKIKVEEGMEIMGLPGKVGMVSVVESETADGVKIKKEQKACRGSEILGFQGLRRRRELMKNFTRRENEQ